MDPFSVTVGVLTIVDICAKTGKALIKVYSDHLTAELEVSGTLLKLETIWRKTETQMELLRKIWDSLDPNHQATQMSLLSALEGKLQESTKLLNGVIGATSEPSDRLPNLLAKKGNLHKKRYVFTVKDSLDKTLFDLLEWYSLFDPSWYLIARTESKDIDRNLGARPDDECLKLLAGLRKSVQEFNVDTAKRPPRPISSRDFLGERTSIASSSISIAPIDGSVSLAVIDTMNMNSRMDIDGTTRSVMTLSRALSRVDPFACGVLRCCGVINKTDRYEFAFQIPQDLVTPRSLRTCLHESKPSLNVRLEFAKQLAKICLLRSCCRARAREHSSRDNSFV